MALQFQKQEISCLQNVLSQVQNLEQTQELRIPEGMPGVGRIPGCWGQVLIRSKAWNEDTVRITGGVQVWLLYVPENSGEPEPLETWIPFQADFELPDDAREGKIRVKALLRFCDARPISAGKVLIRIGIGLQVQCWSPETAAVFHPEGTDADIEVLMERWPVTLIKEAGEKTFDLEEELILPGSLPKPEKLLYYHLTAEITDKKVMGNKLVFRGSGFLHLLYRGENGQLCGWDAELPFSQYVQLNESYLTDARADVLAEVTLLELNQNPEGRLLLHAGLTGQYLITDRELLETAADAYSPLREVHTERSRLDIPVLLEERQETVRAEKRISVQEEAIIDTLFLPDFPRQHQQEDALDLEIPGVIQVLYRDAEGQLQGSNQRWEEKLPMKTAGGNHASVRPGWAQVQIQGTSDGSALKVDVPVLLQFSSGSGIDMVTEAEQGALRPLPETRPSIVLCRAGGKSLWELARQNGSRVALIQAANGLEETSDPNQMLLIPVV